MPLRVLCAWSCGILAHSLLGFVACSLSWTPSKPFNCTCTPQDFTGLISEYVHSVVRDGPSAGSGGGAPPPGDEAVRAAAESTWTALKRSTKAGPRRTVGGLH